MVVNHPNASIGFWTQQPLAVSDLFNLDTYDGKRGREKTPDTICEQKKCRSSQQFLSFGQSSGSPFPLPSHEPATNIVRRQGR